MLLSLFPHLCFKVAPCSHIQSLICCHFHILVGIFHYRTWLVYSYDGLPQMPQVFVSKQGGCTPTSFLLLSIYLQLQCIRCMAIPTPHVDINLWASPQPVDYPHQCETFSFLSSPHNLHHHILFHPQCYIHGSCSCIA